MDIVNAKAIYNLDNIKNSYYIGRGIIMGVTPSAKEFVQIYWTMGRSQNSKNRILVKESDCVKTKPLDLSLETQHEDLTIYNRPVLELAKHKQT